MRVFGVNKLTGWGGISFLGGVAMAACFFALIPLPSLRGPQVIPFLVYYLLAGAVYVLIVLRLGRDRLTLKVIWGFAILFRVLLLFTSPTLSDDVYRYIWDGHLFNEGVNPYTLPVDSTFLDPYNTPLRPLVNHSWMASPYLPTSQLFFALIGRIAPQSVLAFQIGATILDLITAWLLMSLMGRFNLQKKQILIYLWNPLVIIEFAHGAHIDALMICLVVTAFWFLFSGEPGSSRERWYLLVSVIALAAGTLTKVLPLLLVPIFLPRWGWKRVFLYGAIIAAVSALFACGAGWGLVGPLDGKGLFGALRIYLTWWNYNSSLYHWLEVALSGYQTPGAVPVEVVGEQIIRNARIFMTGLLILVEMGILWFVWRLGDKLHDPDSIDERKNMELILIRLAVVTIGAYLIFTHTLHPWYVASIIPFLPFLFSPNGDTQVISRHIWPWIYLSIAVGISYFTYLDANEFHEYDLVRQVEYIPFYLLLGWALWPPLVQRMTLIFDKRIR